ncbi:MAG: DUF5654 family protein [Methanobacteriota archaeon]
MAEPTQQPTTFRLEVLDKIAALMTAGFGLVAALAWNSAIQEGFKQYIPATGTQLTALFIYAVVVTAVAVFFMIWIGRISARAKQRIGRAP